MKLRRGSHKEIRHLNGQNVVTEAKIKAMKVPNQIEQIGRLLQAVTSCHSQKDDWDDCAPVPSLSRLAGGRCVAIMSRRREGYASIKV
jgi:hypothetical protein